MLPSHNHHAMESASNEPTPIWLAALLAISCQATSKRGRGAVRWQCVAGRAIYTNGGDQAVTIEPLGVQLECGQTIAVSWQPGETAYTLELYWPNALCA